MKSLEFRGRLLEIALLKAMVVSTVEVKNGQRAVDLEKAKCRPCPGKKVNKTRNKMCVHFQKTAGKKHWLNKCLKIGRKKPCQKNIARNILKRKAQEETPKDSQAAGKEAPNTQRSRWRKGTEKETTGVCVCVCVFFVGGGG